MKIDSLSPDNTILEELGTRLGRIRKQQGLSQDRLAQSAGIGVATLRRIEDGRDSQLGSWLKILKALQMSASIDALLPETFTSPMAEALAQNKQDGGKKPPRKSSPSTNAGSADIVWGDEKL